MRSPRLLLLLAVVLLVGLGAVAAWTALDDPADPPTAGACPGVDLAPSAGADDPADPAAAGSLIRWLSTELPPAAGQLDAELAVVTAYADGWVAMGNASSGPETGIVVLRSADGRSWERVAVHDAALASGWVTDVVAGGPGLVAVGSISINDRGGSASAIWTSADGSSWTLADRLDGAYPTSVARSADGQLLVVGGNDDGTGLVWLSADGAEWERVALTGPTATLQLVATDVLADAGGWTAVGRIGSDESSRPAILTSADGRSWGCHVLPMPEWDLVSATSIHAADGGYLVTGDGSISCDDAFSLCAGLPLSWATADGARWSLDLDGAGPFAGGGYAFTGADGIGFVAVGHQSVWQSSDGLTWLSINVDDRAGTLGNAQPAMLAYANGDILAVGASHEGGSPRAWIALGEPDLD